MNWGSLVASLLFLVTLSGFAQSTRPGRSQRTDSPAKVIESFEQRRPDAKAVWLPKPIARPSDTFHVDLTRTSRVELPAPEQTEVERKFAAAARRDSRRTMIGIERDTDVSPGAQGEWVRLSINSSKRLWTLTFTSKQARELRVHFTDFALPPGSKLYLYAPGDTTFTQVFEGKGPQDRGEFWSAVFDGDTVNLELLDESGADGDPTSYFSIREISHLVGNVLTSFPGAGSCNLDASCYADWEDTGDSVGRILGTDGAGSFVCSGSLLSNQANDFSPFFLTATHCFQSDDVAHSAIVYWLYRSGSCKGRVPSLASVPQTIGAALLDSNSIGDASLLYLTGNVPSYLPFAGWTTNDPAFSSSITGIHHPQGSWRRIAFGQRISDYSSYGNYHQVLWGNGITEPGSSGSPAFNADHQIVGQLSLGSSSCANPSGTDFYGKLSANFDMLNDTNHTNLLQQGTPDTDSFGAHWTRETAAHVALPLAKQVLAVTVGKEDWYKVTLSSYGMLSIAFDAPVMNYNPAAANLQLYKGSNLDPTQLSYSYSDNKYYFQNDATAGDFYIRVYLTQGAYTHYTFGIEYRDAGLPSARILNPVGIFATYAYVQARVDTGGIFTTTWFEYSTSPDFSNPFTGPTSTLGNVGGTTAFDIFDYHLNLVPGTTYYYRVHAQNPLGNAVSATATFSTLAAIHSAVFSPISISFPTIATGGRNIQYVSFQDTGNVPFGRLTALVTGDFELDPSWQSSIYYPNGSFWIAFTPKTGGTRTGSLTIYDDNIPYTLPLTGTAQDAPVANITYDYSTVGGNYLVGVASTAKLYVSNPGSLPLVISSIQILGLSETYRNTDCFVPVPPGGSCTVELRFMTSVEGYQGGTIVFNDNALGSQQAAYWYFYGTQMTVTPTRPTRPTHFQASSNSTAQVRRVESATPRDVAPRKNASVKSR